MAYLFNLISDLAACLFSGASIMDFTEWRRRRSYFEIRQEVISYLNTALAASKNKRQIELYMKLRHALYTEPWEQRTPTFAFIQAATLLNVEYLIAQVS